MREIFSDHGAIVAGASQRDEASLPIPQVTKRPMSITAADSGKLMNKLYEFFAEVIRDADGAKFFAPCYSSAVNHEKALERGVRDMACSRFSLQDIKGGLRETSVPLWNAHVSAVWPEFREVLPNGEAVNTLVVEGKTFLAPLIGSKDR